MAPIVLIAYALGSVGLIKGMRFFAWIVFTLFIIKQWYQNGEYNSKWEISLNYGLSAVLVLIAICELIPINSNPKLPILPP
jgi:hypothetical protein